MEHMAKNEVVVTVHLRFMRDEAGATYVSITDVVEALRSKMAGSAAPTFVDQFAKELYEGALRAFED